MAELLELLRQPVICYRCRRWRWYVVIARCWAGNRWLHLQAGPFYAAIALELP